MEQLIHETDSQIQQDVLHELKWDTRVPETDVGVEVKNGLVTLTGTVDSYAKKMAAKEAAHRVRGVLDVANDLQVRRPGTGARTDTDIAKTVRKALEWDVYVPDERIQATVSAGMVTLDGTVDFWTQREDAERAVRNLAGVRDVHNNLTIRPTGITPDLQKVIEDALSRHARREAKDVHFKISDGTVLVIGTVHSWAEKELILGAVRGTRGVLGIEDHLTIQP